MKHFIKTFAIFLILCPLISFSQVTVAPVTIHLNDANKNGYIVVRNNSNTSPWEVSIEMKFGYTKSDSSGNTFIYFPEKALDTDPSAVKWISFFPRKFILQPLEEQTVRISAKPQKDIKNGEYWGRPIIISHAVNEVDTTNKEQISVGLSVEFHTVIALNYRKGKVNTGIVFSNLTGSYENDKFTLFADFKREGNAAYLGNINTTIKNDKGEIVKENKQEISVYYDLYRKIEIEAPKLLKGQYSVEVEINTNRDEAGADIINGNSASKKITININ
jgi:hypothetical protein